MNPKPLLLSLGLMLACTTQASGVPTDLQPIHCDNCAEWNQARAPFKLFGHSFYVGPEGVSVLAIDTGAGVILLDGALPQSVEQIVAHLKTVGLRIEDVKFIGITHPHFDHTGGVAALARLSGATVLATAAGADALKLGNAVSDDPQAGFGDAMKFPPVANTRVLEDGESLTLGDTTLTLHATPGHTPGGSSWSWRDCEGDRCIDLVYADSLNPVSHDDFRFSSGERAAQFRASIAKVRALPCDLLVSAHPGQSQLFEREAAAALVGKDQCRAYADDAAARLDRRLAEEAGPQSTAADAQ